MEEKTCTRCEKTKPRTDYYEHGGKCKECVKELQRMRNKRNKKLHEELMKNLESRDQPKTCNECGKTKTYGDFRINRGECLECERDFGRKYNKEHPEIRKKWRDENVEHFAELQANNYQKNKPKIREKYNERYATDPIFKIHQLLKRRLLMCIRKIKSTSDYTGTSFEAVAKWLEYNFTDVMTWENHGIIWDVDHVIPISKWDLSKPEQVEMCFNWKNLSPLSCPKNRFEKRDKIDKKQLIKHKKQLEIYFKENNLNDNELQEYIEKYNEKLISLGETP